MFILFFAFIGIVYMTGFVDVYIFIILCHENVKYEPYHGKMYNLADL